MYWLTMGVGFLFGIVFSIIVLGLYIVSLERRQAKREPSGY